MNIFNVGIKIYIYMYMYVISIRIFYMKLNSDEILKMLSPNDYLFAENWKNEDKKSALNK